MSQPFIGEVRAVGFNFAMRDWAFCDGQLLPISQNTALFSILGTTYGGNGTSTFALPNMMGNAAMQHGTGPGLTPRALGEHVGSSTVTLTVNEMPRHNHAVSGATGKAATETPGPTADSTISTGTPGKLYTNTTTPVVHFSSKAIGEAGGSQAHNNVQPLETLNFLICMFGIFPSRN